MSTQPAADQTIRALITGSTGMVGEGVLHECLARPDVEAVLVINRRSCGITHPKLTEIVHTDFFNLTGLEARLQGYNACFFCLGATSAGKSEEAYTSLTHDLTLYMARVFAEQNPGMVFCYVTASGTDRTEQGRSMWARVKGKTENDLNKLPFAKTFFFRPAFIRPTPGLTRTHNYYYAIQWLYPLVRTFFPKYAVTLQEIGQAMVNVVSRGYEREILESRDIAAAAKQ